MKNVRTWSCVFAMWMAAAAVAQTAAPAAAPTAAPAAKPQLQQFAADAYIAHVKYLASDELEGRAPGSEGSRLAAEYIIEHYQAAGCRPAGGDGSWYQPFEVRRGKKIVESEAYFEIDGEQQKWQVRDDWIPFPFSEYGDIDGPLAFAGYGIQAPKFGYNDYANFDAKGKVLLVLRYEPKANDPDADFGGSTPSRHALFVRKVNVAAKHGAKALLVVNPPNRNPGRDDLYAFNVLNSQQTYQLPMIHIKRAVAEALLKRAGLPDLKALEERIDKQRKGFARDLGLRVKINTGLERNMLPASNILALLPGDGTTKETIVIGAHRDHLGVVPRQFQRDDMTPMIHNGADDNASGSAALLELARALGHGPRHHRNILFISFDAEEMGLLGSKYFVEHPTIPLEDIRAMINFDMIGRLRLNKYTVFGTNSAEEFPDLVGKYAKLLGLKYKTPKGMAGGSDHSPFLRKHIPAMFAFTGIHKQYHQPEDDWQLIDAAGAAKILTMWCPIIVDLANMREGPTYRDPSQDLAEPAPEAPKPAVEENAPSAGNGHGTAKKPAAKAAGPSDAPAPPARNSMRVSLRVIPDMSGSDEPGMPIDTVIKGGPADKAGIKDGDRIVKIGEQDIRDIYAYMRALSEFKPGQTVDVVVVRDGKKKTFKVTLQTSHYKKKEAE